MLFSDSLSCLRAIHYCSNHTLTIDILDLNNVLATGQYDIVFKWLSNHVGNAGNTVADSAAKAALNKSVTSLIVPCSDYKPIIRYHIKDVEHTSINNLQVKTNSTLDYDVFLDGVALAIVDIHINIC